jgi:hypothetical protein
LKNFTAFGLGLPSGRNLLALTRMATSSGVQLRSYTDQYCTYTLSTRLLKVSLKVLRRT